MVLSEAEAEVRLAALRRERDALDRAIADLSLYLELGRRLTGPLPEPAVPPDAAEPRTPARSDPGGRAALRQRQAAPPGDETAVRAAGGGSEATPPSAAQTAVAPREAAVNAAAWGTKGVALSEGVLARRHGRALIEAAHSALDEAGRPLHASEILAVLTARGFSLPGRDPVAALNTRLWKRSGPDGPFRRLGDAVYALTDDAPDENQGGAGRPIGAAAAASTAMRPSALTSRESVAEPGAQTFTGKHRR